MTRIEKARRRVTVARYAIGITAAVALGGFAAAARATHPGTAQRVVARTTVTTTTSDDSNSYFFGDDSGSYSNIGPSGSAQPQVQSGAS
ncbi:MAG TPA: hypothetical protein VLJ44_13995 [Gaiellaceae bacterium]|nr:hypothetical protein [Gaiellaceae bacterium]